MRKMSVLVTLSVAVFSLGNVQTAVAQSDTNYEQLKPMEWVIGSWQRRWSSDGNDRADSSKQWRFQWTANKNALLITQVSEKDKKVTGQLDALFGWSSQVSEILGSGVGSDGIAGTGWKLTPESESFTITAGKSDWVFQKVDNDTLTLTNPGGKKVKFRRIDTTQSN